MTSGGQLEERAYIRPWRTDDRRRAPHDGFMHHCDQHRPTAHSAGPRRRDLERLLEDNVHASDACDSRRSGGGDAGSVDGVDVSCVGAATPAEHVDVWVRPQEVGVERPELDRVPLVELLGCVELCVAGA